jgi:Tfp pilus assembly protein PilP
VSYKLAPIVIQVSNPAAFSGQGSIIGLEMADEDAAVKIARKIARETGRIVTVRDAEMAVIETIPAASTH